MQRTILYSKDISKILDDMKNSLSKDFAFFSPVMFVGGRSS